jgi:hypothetical protein
MSGSALKTSKIMTIYFKDFIPNINANGLFLQEYESVEETLLRVNRWITQHSVEVLNIETVLVPTQLCKDKDTSSKHNSWQVGSISCQVIRVWHSTLIISKSSLFNSVASDRSADDFFRDFSDLNPIEFPIITISGNTVEAVVSAQEFRQCSVRAFEDGYFSGLEIFDSNSQRFVVKSFRNELELGEIDGIHMIAVSFQINKLNFVEFNDVRERIAKSFSLKEHKVAAKQQETFTNLYRFIVGLTSRPLA